MKKTFDVSNGVQTGDLVCPHCKGPPHATPVVFCPGGTGVPTQVRGVPEPGSTIYAPPFGMSDAARVRAESRERDDLRAQLATVTRERDARPLAILQAAIEESKNPLQRQTGIKERTLFLGTEVGEVQKEVLKLAGMYGPEKAATAKEHLAAEICDLVWNALDLATLAGIQLDEPMQTLLSANKTRVWEPAQDAAQGPRKGKS